MKKNTNLIKIITNETGEPLVNGRELWQFLNVGRHFNSWIKGRIEKYDFIENEDFMVLPFASPNGVAIKTVQKGGQNKLEYLLTIDMAKELAMIENNPAGRLARKYFIQCEKKYKELLLNNHNKEIEKIQNEANKLDFYKSKVDSMIENYDNVDKFIVELIKDGETLKKAITHFNNRMVQVSLYLGQGRRYLREIQAGQNELYYNNKGEFCVRELKI